MKTLKPSSFFSKILPSFWQVVAVFALVAGLVGAAQAGTGQKFPPTDAGRVACEKSASAYKVTSWPTSKPKPGWVATADKHVLKKGQCVKMNVVSRNVDTSGKALATDYRYVYMPIGTVFLKHDGSWWNADCINHTDLEVLQIKKDEVKQAAGGTVPGIQGVGAAGWQTATKDGPEDQKCNTLQCRLADHNATRKALCDSDKGVFTPATEDTFNSSCVPKKITHTNFNNTEVVDHNNVHNTNIETVKDDRQPPKPEKWCNCLVNGKPVFSGVYYDTKEALSERCVLLYGRWEAILSKFGTDSATARQVANEKITNLFGGLSELNKVRAKNNWQAL